ncbi:MAG: RNA polymerase sigma factor [Planctomycetota bacterium]|jgi:RNA polymerase sigma-70 factor (ECF subfamily)
MDQKMCQIDLVRRARRGDRECLDQLAEQAKERLRTYVYRMTQDNDLTQEIVQETLFEMVKALGKLKNAERFWPWLHGIATNKLRRFYRTERTQRNLAVASAKRKETLKDRQDGLENLVSEELKGIVSAAMKRLRVRHKAVLIMRCYDGMTHSEIAESLGCSEFSTRMLFLRAKRALQRELSRNGFNKGSLLAALVVFGKMTAPTEAAAAQVSVTAAATKVGLLAEVAVLATAKTTVVSLTAAGALTAGTIVAPSILSKQDIAPPANPQAVSQFGLNSNASEQYLYYFPHGPAGPVMLRANSGVVGGKSSRQILQDDEANYDYHDGVARINNHRAWAGDLSVPILPTDNAQLAAFLHQAQPGARTVPRVGNKGANLLVLDSLDETGQSNRPEVIRHPSALDADYFQPDWAAGKPVDNRDAMHKRGWTYFRIRGKVNGRKVFGAGRIPFVNSASRQYSPWMKLQVGSLTIVDRYDEAHISRAPSTQLGTYRGGSFFKGLARPWMGLHTIDTVRRDAAERSISFETGYLPDSRFAQVELDCDGVKLTYKIDLETDVIDEITFSTDQGDVGNLKFSYLQSIEGATQEFAPPARLRQRTASKSNPGLLWLVQLMEGSFD